MRGWTLRPLLSSPRHGIAWHGMARTMRSAARGRERDRVCRATSDDDDEGFYCDTSRIVLLHVMCSLRRRR
ncbi:hypothetical protein VTN02DRAFT_6346 [Thermoascus thermophilus]